MDNNTLELIQKHTRATRQTTKVLAEFIIYSAVAVTAGVLVALLALLLGAAFELAILGGLIVGGIGQVFVIFRSFADLRALL